MDIFSVVKKCSGIETILFDERFIDGGHKIEQIRLIRKRFQLGLREAKEIVDLFYQAMGVIPNNIKDISPSFSVIYSQAFRADLVGLKEICGAGYRKALEHLIKDYLIRKIGIKKEDVEIQQLGRCIERYVEDDFIKKLADRAAWLGNDETHYYRRWKDKDLDDLKKLIHLTINAINIRLNAESIIESMPCEK